MLVDTCSWDNPGSNRYTSTAEAAIKAYTEIPEEERAQLIKAINTRNYSDLVIITKNEIKGITDKKYEPTITNMHFGNSGKLCKNVDRSNWPSNHFERAMVFESTNYTVIWPSVCGNFSIIKKITYTPSNMYNGYPGGGSIKPPTPIPEPWMFPIVLAYAAYFTFKRK